MPKQIKVSWSRTEEFTHTFTVEDVFDRENPEHEEALIDKINSLGTFDELDAYTGCPDLSITEVTAVEVKP